MDTIKEQENICQKYTHPEIIQIVIEAIDHFKKTRFLKLDMSSFGHARDTVCYGCMATCAVFYLMDETPNKDNIENHPINGYTEDSVDWFEFAVDELRCGSVSGFIYELYDLEGSPVISSEEYAHFDNFEIGLSGSPSDEELDQFKDWLITLKEEIIEFEANN